MEENITDKPECRKKDLYDFELDNIPPKDGIKAGDEIPRGFQPELVHRALAIYATLRTFSKVLRLSPFSPFAFLRSLSFKFRNSLTDEIHFSLLRFIGANCVQPDALIFPSPGPDWKYLDNITWPYYLSQMVFIMRKQQKEALEDYVEEEEEAEMEKYPHLKIAKRLQNEEYHEFTQDEKLYLLQWLCDRLIDLPLMKTEIEQRLSEEIRAYYRKKLVEMKIEEPQLSRALTLVAGPNNGGSADGTPVAGAGGAAQEAKDLFDLEGRLLQVLGKSETCALCQDLGGGGLVTCSDCKLSYHHSCVKSPPTQPKEWHCPECLILDPSKGNARMAEVKTRVEGYRYLKIVHGYVFRILKKQGKVALLSPYQVADFLLKLGEEKASEWPYSMIWHPEKLFETAALPSAAPKGAEAKQNEMSIDAPEGQEDVDAKPLDENISEAAEEPTIIAEPKDQQLIPTGPSHPCQVPGCVEGALYGFEGQMPPLMCGIHQSEGMVLFQMDAEPKKESGEGAEATNMNNAAEALEGAEQKEAVQGNEVPQQQEPGPAEQLPEKEQTVAQEDGEEEEEEDEDEEEEDDEEDEDGEGGAKEDKSTPTPAARPRKERHKGADRLRRMPLYYNPLLYNNKYAEALTRKELPQLDLATCSLKRYPLYRIFHLPKDAHADMNDAEDHNRINHFDAVVQLLQNTHRLLQGLMEKTASPAKLHCKWKKELFTATNLRQIKRLAVEMVEDLQVLDAMVDEFKAVVPPSEFLNGRKQTLMPGAVSPAAIAAVARYERTMLEEALTKDEASEKRAAAKAGQDPEWHPGQSQVAESKNGGAGAIVPAAEGPRKASAKALAKVGGKRDPPLPGEAQAKEEPPAKRPRIEDHLAQVLASSSSEPKFVPGVGVIGADGMLLATVNRDSVVFLGGRKYFSKDTLMLSRKVLKGAARRGTCYPIQGFHYFTDKDSGSSVKQSEALVTKLTIFMSKMLQCGTSAELTVYLRILDYSLHHAALKAPSSKKYPVIHSMKSERVKLTEPTSDVPSLRLLKGQRSYRRRRTFHVELYAGHREWVESEAVEMWAKRAYGEKTLQEKSQAHEKAERDKQQEIKNREEEIRRKKRAEEYQAEMAARRQAWEAEQAEKKRARLELEALQEEERKYLRLQQEKEGREEEEQRRIEVARRQTLREEEARLNQEKEQAKQRAEHKLQQLNRERDRVQRQVDSQRHEIDQVESVRRQQMEEDRQQEEMEARQQGGRSEEETQAAYARAQQAQMDALMKARRAQMAPDDPQLQAQARAAREAAIAAQEAAGPADWQAAYRQQHEGQGDGTQPGGQVPSLHQSWDEGGEGYDEGMEHYGTEDEQAVSFGGETLTADDVAKRKQSLRGKYYRSRAQYKSAVIKLLHEYLGGSSEQFSSTRDKMNVFRERMNDLRESAAAKMKQVLDEAESLRPELRSWNPEQITQLQEEIQSKIVKDMKNAEASAQQQFREVRGAREGQMDQTAGMAEEEAQQSHYEMQDQGETASGAQGDEASASADAFQQQQMQLQQQLATALTHHHQQQDAAQMATQQSAQYATQLAQYQDQLRELQQMQAASQRDMLQAQLRGDAPGYMTAQRNLQSLQQRVLATTHQVQQAGAQAAAAQQQAQAAAAAAAAAQQQAQQLQQQVQQHQQQQQQTQYVSQVDINPHLQGAYGGIQQVASHQQGQQQAGAQDQSYQMQQQQQQQAMAQAQQQGQDPRWAQQQQYWQQQGGDANAQQASQQQQQMQQQMANQQQGASSEDATRDHWAAQWSQIYGQQNPQAKALKGGVFALTGTVSIPRKQLRKMVIADGGKVEENVTERTTHLITKAGFSSQKVVDAFKYGIPAVSVEYIEMCIKQGELLDVRKPEIKSLLLKINPQPNGTPIVKMEEDGSGQFTASVGAQASAGLPLRGGVFAISGDLSIPTTRLAEIIRFNGGQVVEDAEEDAVTHVVTTPTNLLDLPTKVFGALNKSVALVTEDYIQASIEHGKLLDLDNKENHTFLVLNVHDQDTSETASIKEPVPTSERRQIQAATVNRQLMDISIRKMQKLGLTISETPEKQLQISKILAEASLEVKTKMQVGDILHKINGSKVTSLPEVGDILSKIQLGLAMQLQVERLPDADQKHSLEQGDSFGELAIMYNDPRAATCKAATDCKLWALDRVSFKSELNAQKESEKAHTDDDAAQVSDLLTDDRNVPQSIGLPQKRKRTVQVYFCTKCNKDTAEAFKFCPDCGSKLVTKVKSGHAIRSDKSFNKNADVIIL